MAKDGIIIYSSQTGFTKRYAEYMAEELDYDIKPVRKANLFRVSCYPVVIYGGGLHHNRIDGIRGLVEGSEYLGDQTRLFPVVWRTRTPSPAAPWPRRLSSIARSVTRDASSRAATELPWPLRTASVLSRTASIPMHARRS